jgi:hypothetical protein
MTPNRLVSHRQSLSGKNYQFPDFDITWAGECPWDGGYCFGSDDGRVRGFNWGDPKPIAASGEAVNGVAFIGDKMAVSTRAEVVFCDLGLVGLSGKRVGVVIRPCGAHGVIATPSGTFVAPKGPLGFLKAVPMAKVMRCGMILGPEGADLVFYKIAVVGDHQGHDVLVAALRKGGWATWINNGLSVARGVSLPGLDAIDVCSPRVERFPRAAVVLGIDNSFHIVKDAMVPGPVNTLRLPGLRGKAYRLLGCREGILLLTSESLYHFGDIFQRCLEGQRVDGVPTVFQRFDLEAVDANIAHGRNLLIVRPDGGVTDVALSDFAEGLVEGASEVTKPESSSGKVEWKQLEWSERPAA